MKDTTAVFSDNLRAVRRERRMTQKALAERLGYSEKAISKWESGHALPPSAVLPELARALGIGIDDLFTEGGNVRYYLGIDGGGTKTDFVLTDAEGQVRARTVLEASNPNDVGEEVMRDVLARGIRTVMRGYPYAQTSAFAGIAGGITGRNRDLILSFLEEYRFAAASCGSDAENAVAAGLGDGDGIAVILGTGSIAFAKRGGTVTRYGGFGYLFGDVGSGFSIGRDGILAALHEEEGSGPPTAITGAAVAHLGGQSVLSELATFYRDGKRAVAALAPLVFEAYRSGDAVAERILQKNAEGIASLISAAAGSHRESPPLTVVLCGGLTAYQDILIPLICRALGEEARRYCLAVCERPMVYGALRRAGLTAEPRA